MYTVLCAAPLGLPAGSSLSAPPMADRVASTLYARGFAVLDRPQLDLAALALLRGRTSSRLDDLLSEIRVAGVDPIEQHYTFGEIAHRQRLRWDLRLPATDEAWVSACEAAVAAATPVLERLHPACEIRTLMSGVLISRDGAEAQSWHADADTTHFERAREAMHCRIYNAFMPLVDVARDGDGTEFWEGTHGTPCPSTPSETDPPPGAAEAPACPAGGLVLADYRTLHRGRANQGRERQVAYVVLGVGEGAEDNSNFTPDALADVSPRVLEQLPWWSDWE